MFEVYREKVILGIPYIENSDINIFFRNKEVQSEVVASWNDGIKRRLGSVYINYMCDANLLMKVGRQKAITPPILDIRLQKYLEKMRAV